MKLRSIVVRVGLVSLVSLLAGCRDNASDERKATDTMPITTAAPARSSAPSTSASPLSGAIRAAASASASASAAPVAAASGSARKGTCAPIAWNADKSSAAETTLEGTLITATGLNGRSEEEKFFLLRLDKPACGLDGSPEAEVHVYASNKSVDLNKVLGRRVSVRGEPFPMQTAHHHRNIVIDAKSVDLSAAR